MYHCGCKCNGSNTHRGGFETFTRIPFNLFKLLSCYSSLGLVYNGQNNRKFTSTENKGIIRKLLNEIILIPLTILGINKIRKIFGIV